MIVGDPAVGKSTIVDSYVNNSFNRAEYVPTIASKLTRERLELNNAILNVEIYDMAGQKQFASIIRGFIHTVDTVLIVYDLTRIETMVSAIQWFRTIRSICKYKDVALVGNKKDLLSNNKNAIYNLKDFIKDDPNFTQYYPISAKTLEGLDDLFKNLTLKAVTKKRRKKGGSDFCKTCPDPFCGRSQGMQFMSYGMPVTSGKA